MPLPFREVIRFLVDNLDKYGIPIPVSPNKLVAWSDGLGIKKGGERVLYTGLLYQLTPYIEGVVDYLAKIEESRGGILKVARLFGKIIDISRFLPEPDKGDLLYYNNILRNIALILRRNDIDFGYLYMDEPYSGVLLYDIGYIDKFKMYIRRVYKIFKEHGVKEIITVDPHTSYITRNIYPKYIDDFDITVHNYLELLDVDKVSVKLDGEIVIHDPCYYSRYLNIIEEPRRILSKGGINIIEPTRTKRLSYCCGGPIESISPRIASTIARNRFDELKMFSKKLIVMCPICLSNLRNIADEECVVEDVSSYISKIYGVEK